MLKQAIATVAISISLSSISAFAENNKYRPYQSIDECHDFLNKYSQAVSGLTASTFDIQDVAKEFENWSKSKDASKIAKELRNILSGRDVVYGPNLTYVGITMIYSNKRPFYKPGFLQPSRESLKSAFYSDFVCTGQIDLKGDIQVLRDDLNVLISKLYEVKDAYALTNFDHRIKRFEDVLMRVNALPAQSNN